MTDRQKKVLLKKTLSGDRKALETLLQSVQDMVFNLSLRMLGTVPDAEDAAQEIYMKVMEHLPSFRQECSFSTWVFRIAANDLQSYRKNMFAKRPLSFEAYGMDIACGKAEDVPDLRGGVDAELLAKELKLSCTNVMLQCLDAQSRCIFILGTMFRLDSRVAGEILELSSEAYRQRLSRIRHKMAAFLREYCGWSGTGICSCKKRVNYAIANHRINPHNLEYLSLEACTLEKLRNGVRAMEQLDDASQLFSELPAYHTTKQSADFIRKLIASSNFQFITRA